MLDNVDYIPRLRADYDGRIKAAMTEEFGYKNNMMIPRLDKIVLNIGCGAEAVKDSKKAKSAQADLSAIAGQNAVITKAKKSIAGFKIREGMPIGTSVTLRGDRMWEFYDRFVQVVVPRIRDFRGFNKKSFDGNGNYTLGIKEQLIFPEISFDKIDSIRGMDITIVTSASTDQEGKALLKELGMPFSY